MDRMEIYLIDVLGFDMDEVQGYRFSDLTEAQQVECKEYLS